MYAVRALVAERLLRASLDAPHQAPRAVVEVLRDRHAVLLRRREPILEVVGVGPGRGAVDLRDRVAGGVIREANAPRGGGPVVHTVLVRGRRRAERLVQQVAWSVIG